MRCRLNCDFLFFIDWTLFLCVVMLLEDSYVETLQGAFTDPALSHKDAKISRRFYSCCPQ
jgi:hypothetical protein